MLVYSNRVRRQLSSCFSLNPGNSFTRRYPGAVFILNPLYLKDKGGMLVNLFEVFIRPRKLCL